MIEKHFVNSTSQGILAKLLAKENISVETGNYSTAFFDVKNRILGLPTWNVDSKCVCDLLVGHEVGHALYTPMSLLDGFKEVLPNCPFDVLNIVEDIRIERLVQDQYPGIRSSFMAGYAQFIEKDFFGIKGDIASMRFIDRLNLRGKIGNQVEVPMSAEEEDIYQRCLRCETPEDVIEVCKLIHSFIKSNLEDESEQETNQSDSPQSPSNKGTEHRVRSEDLKKNKSEKPSQDAEGDDQSFKQESDSTQQADDRAPKQNPSSQEEESDAGGSKANHSKQLLDNLKSQTLNDLNEQLSKLQENSEEYTPISCASVKQMMDTVIPVSALIEARKQSANYDLYFNSTEVSCDWKQFKNSAKQHVNLLVKEFDRRKAAFQYSRAQRSLTGSIDVNRLHSYKFEDQIFKSVTKLADAKNHGMMFFIDYSGSMWNDISNVLSHTLNLVFFCKAVGIPFEVYGFTNPPSSSSYDIRYSVNSRQLSLHNCSVFELLNSDMGKAQYELACRQLRAQAFLLGSITVSSIPTASRYEKMAGTPLYQTIIVAHELVKRFRAKHNVQKMNTIFLTDGDGCSLSLGSNNEYEYAYAAQKNKNFMNYRVRLNGRNVIINCRSTSMCYATLIENLRITTGTTAIGFFISGGRTALKNSAINALRHTKGQEAKEWMLASDQVSRMAKDFRKNKFMKITKGFAFDEYFVICSNDLSIEEEGEESFELDEDFDATTNAGQKKLAKAFTQYTVDKRSSRMILNQFAAIIA